MVLVVKSPPANAGDIRGAGLIPGSGRSPEGGHGNSLQYSCLENPMDRGAWWYMVHRVTKSRTRLKQLSMYAEAHLLGQVGGPSQAWGGINSRAHSWGRQTGCGLWAVSMGWSQRRGGHFLGVCENQLFCPVVIRKMSDLADCQNYGILLSLTKIRI